MTETASPSTAAERFEQLVNSSELSQKDIADRLNYTKPNIITMFKQGLTKIPIEKIPAIARLFHIDAAEFLKLAMGEYEPRKYAAIIEILGEPVTDYERRILKAIRETVDESELKYNTTHYCEVIKECLNNTNQ